MSEVLKLARQLAAKDLSWIEAVIHDGQREQRINAAKATLDAIDAAIAAGTPVKGGTTEVNIDLGNGQVVTLNVSATDLRDLEETLARGRRVRPVGERALEDAIAAPAKKPAIQIPNDVKFLTAGVDVANGRFEVAVYGWTASGEPADVEHFVSILDDYPLSDKRAWGALEEFLKRPFRRDDGLYLHIQAACIDSGGMFTREVYDFAKENVVRRWWAVKSRSNRKGERTAVWPEAPVKTCTGALLYMIDFDQAHEEMAGMLSFGGVLADAVVFAYAAAKGLVAIPGSPWAEMLKAAPAKETKPLRIPIEFDTSALVEELEGAIAYFKSEKPGSATGGVATGEAPFGVVGERAGETVVATFKSGIESVKQVSDETDTAWSNREWSVFGDTDDGFPGPGQRRFDLGHWVEVNVPHKGDVHCAVGQIVEITLRKGPHSFFRIHFPNGFVFENDLFLAENMTHARQEAIVQ